MYTEQARFLRDLCQGSETFLSGRLSGQSLSHKQKERYLPATWNVTGSRAPGQGLKLGGDTKPGSLTVKPNSSF